MTSYEFGMLCLYLAALVALGTAYGGYGVAVGLVIVGILHFF